MRPTRNTPPLRTAARESDARRNRRLRSHGLTCSVGEVVDFSASGIGVAISGRRAGIVVGQQVNVRIDGVVGSFSVAATVVWVRTTGASSHLAGLRLEGVTPEIAAHLASLARAPEIGPFGIGGPTR